MDTDSQWGRDQICCEARLAGCWLVWSVGRCTVLPPLPRAVGFIIILLKDPMPATMLGEHPLASGQ